MNGEGYKVLESDSTFKAALGFSITPVTGAYLRLYFDNMAKEGTSQNTVELIAYYESNGAALSAAYNYRKNHLMQKNHDYHAITVNGSVAVGEKTKLIGRFDNVSAIIPDDGSVPWYPSKEGQLYLIGLQHNLVPGVNISPNFQGWQPSGSRPFVTGFYLSLDLKL
jgi:hypothetical protein